MKRLAIYCADIGSVKKGRFGWARECQTHKVELKRGARESILELTKAVVNDLKRGNPVALGFECPLFVPLPEDPIMLTAARQGDGNRSWSAGAGAACLTTGLTETLWILDSIRKKLPRPIQVYLRWNDFRKAQTGLFLWEAFVTKKAKRKTDVKDAGAAVKCFSSLMPNVELHNAIESKRVRSLIGAAILQTGFSSDLSLLETSCLVIKVKERNRVPPKPKPKPKPR